MQATFSRHAGRHFLFPAMWPTLPPCRSSFSLYAGVICLPPCGQLSHAMRADVYPSCREFSPCHAGRCLPPCGQLSHHMGYFLSPSGSSSFCPAGRCPPPCGQLSHHVGYFFPPCGRLFSPPCGHLSPTLWAISPCRMGRCLPPCGQLSPTMWATFSPPCRQLSPTLWATFSPPCGSLSSAMRAPFCHRVVYFLPSCVRLSPRHAGHCLLSCGKLYNVEPVIILPPRGPTLSCHAVTFSCHAATFPCGSLSPAMRATSSLDTSHHYYHCFHFYRPAGVNALSWFLMSKCLLPI